MTMPSHPLRGGVFALLVSVLAPAALAAPDVATIAPGVRLLSGTSGNVLIVDGPTGALIVDDERATDIAEIEAAVGAGPVRIVINTHWHLDHSGGNEAFAKAGATIIAQRNVRLRRRTDQFMAAYNKTIPAAPADALPSVVFDAALDVYQGGETLHLTHAPNAHTDGDIIVRLEKANVLHLGDIFFNGLFPFIDTGSGGGIQGLIAAVDTALALADAKTVIVPSHGAIADRAALQAYRDMLADVSAKVEAGIAAGKSLEEIRDSHPAAPYQDHLQGDADRFVTAIYESLTKT
ncbi:hypothetical protein sos41_14190 [Alphaproteobacteria bacterium SO-S41]|nr:hypothetical protein sos41_14190 [Alphaproteobacteria bacterium SO-S41]